MYSYIMGTVQGSRVLAIGRRLWVLVLAPSALRVTSNSNNLYGRWIGLEITLSNLVTILNHKRLSFKI